MVPADTSPSTIAVIMTVHNRRELTLTCLERLAEQDVHGHRLQVYLTDDGSTDGTGDAVREAHPDVVVLEGDGQLFWTGGMRLAMGRAMEDRPAYHLLLNDDTFLDARAVDHLVRTSLALSDDGRPPSVVVGAVRDPATGEPSYGGILRGPWWQPMRFRMAVPRPESQPVDTFHANCALLPAAVVDRVGNLDPAYVHSMGDFDYGFRAREAGCEVWLAPGTVGECEPNPGFVDRPDVGLADEFARWRSVKHLPPRQWRTFTSRWAGPAWPIFFVSPYVLRLVDLVRTRVAGRRPGAGARSPSS